MSATAYHKLGFSPRDRATATDPDTLFTPETLVRHMKQAARLERSPIGVKQIRAAIKHGELYASKVGNRNQIRWANFLRWLDGPCRIHPDLNTDEKIDAEVTAQLQRECTPIRQRHQKETMTA
jgi:hypothetical protein